VSLLILLGFTCGGYLLIWLMQAVALACVGETNIWAQPFRHPTRSNLVRWVRKLAIQTAIFSTLLLFPFTIGSDPVAYHLSWLSDPPWHAMIVTFGLTLAVFLSYQALNVCFGWMSLEKPEDPWNTFYRVCRSALTPIPLAIVEEALFRGVVLRQMLADFPATSLGVILAVLLSAAAFSSVHFIRPHKESFLPALGLFSFGILLGIVYVAVGQNCWLCVAIHAGGVWVIQTLRRFVKYNAPPWLIGYPTYPICGAMGFLSMAILTLLVVARA
jgi:hypothetical protein